MEIREVKVDHFCIPLPAVLSDSVHGAMPDFELVTVFIRTDSGLEGVGYTYTVGRGGSSIRALIEHELTSILIGADPRCIERIWSQMWWLVHWVGRGGIAAFAISAIDIALWDIKGKALAEPLWRLLGGTQSKKIMAYAGGIDLFFSSEELRVQTESFLERGFRAIKVKVGSESMVRDIERVRLVRDIVEIGRASCRERV